MTTPSEPLISALNHIAIVTKDLDRFIDFYVSVLGLQLLFREEVPGMRHAILRTGELSWIHPVEVDGNPHATASKSMFQRGHLDHMALTATNAQTFETLRQRLVSMEATDGIVERLGAFSAFWFNDPDGMRVEIALILDRALERFHAPVREN